jgi:hypothetical protein
MMGKRKSRSNLKIPEPKIEVVDGNPQSNTPPLPPPPPLPADQVPVSCPSLPIIDKASIPPPLNLNNESGPLTKDRQTGSESFKEPLKKKKPSKKSLKTERRVNMARIELAQVLSFQI